jgi:predicted TIM-barrel fold metal-dependent hydrolase
MTVGWILGVEYGTSVATILHPAFTPDKPMTQARSGGVMVIVDAQVHIWGPDTPQRPWAPGGAIQAHRPVPLRKDEIIREMDAAEVDRVGIVPPSWEGHRLVLDHLALSGEIRDAALGPALEPVLAAARHPNIAVKASAMPCYVTESYPFPSLHQHIRRVVDAYDPQRVFWGTDLTRLSCPYRQAVTLFTEELEFLSDEDRERIMGRGIAEWLGWPLPRN